MQCSSLCFPCISAQGGPVKKFLTQIVKWRGKFEEDPPYHHPLVIKVITVIIQCTSTKLSLGVVVRMV